MKSVTLIAHVGRCRRHRPPPAPLRVNDDFEKTPVGQTPAHARVSGEDSGAAIRVSADRAASGRQSLKITDTAAVQPSWQPHFYYEPYRTEGMVRHRFDVWMEPDSQFFTEWRDASDYPQNVGPSVRFDGNGNVAVGGKVLARMPAETWFRVEIQAVLGPAAPRTFQLTLTPPGAESQTFTELPMSGAEFRELHWLGYSSTAAADTVFYVDNMSIP